MAIWPVGYSGDHRNIAKNEGRVFKFDLETLSFAEETMEDRVKNLIDRLYRGDQLEVKEYKGLVEGYTQENAAYARKKAVKVRKRWYGNKIFIRGLIELTNICKNDCYYCGIRHSNKNISRYRLTKEEVMESCREGYALGFRTFVLQGGEDGYFTDVVMTDLLRGIKREYPKVAITLSIGERSKESYQRLFDAGADRFLLRHETAKKEHYQHLHPEQMSFERRLECLRELKEIGFYVGCGFMVGSPGQTVESLAMDLKLIENLQPQMCGIGPFIPQKDTPFRNEKAGSADFTCYLLSLIRLICPKNLLPSTTALSTIDDFGREKGILAGANVVMPNLSPFAVRSKYTLYDKKVFSGSESAQELAKLKERMCQIGYEIVEDRGDMSSVKEEE